MVKALFEWLDGNAWSYWAGAIPASLLLFAGVARAVRAEAGDGARRGAAGWRDAAVLGLFLLAWRWPFLLRASEYNPDESQLLAGALTLTRDPVFWRSVDGTTSGPLNFYLLLPLHWLGLPLDYFTARLAGLLLVWGSLTLCLRTLAAGFGRAAAWLGVLAAAGFFATLSSYEFVHFSSEHTSLLLVAASAAWLATRPPGDRARLWAAAFVAGAAPWAKLQVAPIGVGLIAWGLWQAWREQTGSAAARVRAGLGVLVAGAAPTLLAVALITATGQALPAWQRYFVGNLRYAGLEVGLGDALRRMRDVAAVDGRMPLFLVTTAVVTVAALSFVWRRRVRVPELLVVGAVLTLAAVVAILTPRRDALHYTLLLPVPLTLLAGAAVGAWWRELRTARGRWLLAGALLAGAGAVPVVTRCFQPRPEPYGHFLDQWRYPHERTSVLVQELAGPGGSLAIWGWASYLYVEAGLPQGTRDAHTFWSILPGRERDYHRAGFLADLRRNRPEVFVDAVGPGAFGYQERALQAHETFPELAQEIQRSYTYVCDLGDARVYARNGLPTLPAMTPAHIAQLLARGRLRLGLNGVRPDDGSGDRLARWVVEARWVMMMQPPVGVQWTLTDDVRCAKVEFGFAPAAYEQGTTNGAEFILDLVGPQGTRTVWRRFLDPRKVPSDRGRQTARVPLPPFAPGSRLVLRTDPGPFGDTAWDWVYLAYMDFERGPRFVRDQVPGFEPVPDAVEAPGATLEAAGAKHRLVVHGPASVVYALTGREHELAFTFGRPAGGIGGAVALRAEIHSAGRPSRLVLESDLAATTAPGAETRAEAWVLLTDLRAGDRLLLRVEPMDEAGGSVYLSGLNLK